MATGYYHQNLGDLKSRLKEAVPHEELKKLHVIQPGRHLLSAFRLFLSYGLALGLLIQVEQPIYWIPLAIWQGFTILGFIILLHELVHDLAFRKPRPRIQSLLATLYALPSGIAPSQFRRWHLDHHDELGSDSEDPKRAHLSPKSNQRWLKLLYFTPALFLIYARAAGRAAKGYTVKLRRRISLERILAVLVHGGLAYLLYQQGEGVLFRAWFCPLFLCFPPIFLLNRLGQHYSIDPDDPAHWSTRVDGHWLWRWLFVNSNHHIEHHYYPKVPHYHLPALNRQLRPFFEEQKIANNTYSSLIWNWFVRNKPPHSQWSSS